MAVSLNRHNGTLAFIYWIWDGLDRTIFTAIKFSFPARFVSPFGFLGMLTFITFIILGVSNRYSTQADNILRNKTTKLLPAHDVNLLA